jgi:hypothetical protein
MRILAVYLLTACSKPECEGPPTCSSDATELTTCEDGEPVTIRCMADQGRLCESGSCVDPWRYGSPAFSACEGEPRATPESLAEKAEAYDAIAVRLHLHPGLGFVQNVRLEPSVPEQEATYLDVASFESGENDGLWSALYLASQAYRYGATQSPEALETIRTLLDGEDVRMRITGVPGIFTRQYVPPGIGGIECPTSTASYAVDEEKDDNRWVQIRDDGCVHFVARDTGQWTKSDHCGLSEFAGYCFLDNVSKDEYAGHLFALGALAKLVDVPDVQEKTRSLLERVGRHLVENRMALVDWDGRITEHGRFRPFHFDDFPGFNAAMGMEHILIAARATKSPELERFYDDCLLQRSGRVDCLESGLVDIEPYTAFLPLAGMYVGPEGCGSNYNNVSMHMLSMHHLIWYEQDPRRRALIQRSFDEDVVRAEDQPRAIIRQNNAFFDFMWAAQKALGPASDGPAFEAVENGVCMLRQFRASQAAAEITLDPERFAPHCKDRFDRDVSDTPRTPADRCSSTFVWWGDPYSLSSCAGNDREIRQPAGYLLPYWMGRFYGFVAADT